MDESPSFGRLLRQYRRARDLTQEGFARQTACALTTIKKIETDERRPSRDLAARMARILAVPAADVPAFVQLARGLADRAIPHPLSLAPAASAAEIGAADLVGRAVRGYLLRERLGVGGFALVYRATQSAVQREVAIKIILPRFANQPEFVRRFEAEAQLIARLEHPQIVPLYDFWREPDRAYLVMRYLRGGSLADVLRSGPLDTAAALRILEQVGEALAAAHRAGVIHRDLKPANVLLDTERNAYLADFGIATELADSTPTDATADAAVIVGSPDYLAPEQIVGSPLTPQVDLYSLGVLLYEVLTGTKPFHAPTPGALLQLHLTAPLPSLRERRVELPVGLDVVVQRATAKRPEDRYSDVASLVADVRAALAGSVLRVGMPQIPTVAREVDPTVPRADETPANPYKGLRAFTEADAADFCGRDALVQRLLERLADAGTAGRFLAVVGPSGSGKSSVVRAGLIPALRRGGVDGSERWFLTDCIPGAHPLDELELALRRVAVRAPPDLVEQLRRDARGLLRAARLILPDDASELLLLVDQFEELFTLAEHEAERIQMLDLLTTAVSDARSRVRVIITLRADFYDRPLRYAAVGALLRERTEPVLPLAPEELEQAIVAPATRAGLALELGLATEISRDLGGEAGTLPLLQYALTELFARRDDRTLTRAAYQESGAVRGALARRAQALHDGLDAAGQALVRQIFLRLITLGEGAEDTRRRVRLAELPTSAVAARVLAAYGDARLLTFDRDPHTRAPTVEVAHEALIRAWGRLREWLDASRDDLRVQRRLLAAAAEWTASERDASFLASGARLAQLAALPADSDLALNDDEMAYLEASLAERDRRAIDEHERQARELAQAQALATEQRQRAEEQTAAGHRLRRRAVLLAAALVLAVLTAAAAGFFATGNATLATQNAAIARTAQIAGGQAIAGQATAVTESQLRATQQTIAQTNLIQSERQRLAAQATNLLDQSTSGDLPALLALRSLKLGYSPEADAALLRAIAIGFPRLRFAGDNLPEVSVSFSPDGRYVLTGNESGTVRLWDATTGQLVRQFAVPAAGINTVAFSPDGRYVVTAAPENVARLWDVATGKEVREFVGHSAHVYSAAFSPDGQFIVTASPDKTTRLWNVATGAEIRQFIGHTDTVYQATFSPDGHFVLTGSADNTVRLWDAATGKELRRFTGLGVTVGGVVFSPDGRYLLLSGSENIARLWDSTTGQEIRQFSGHTDVVNQAAFSPDGRYILTGSSDNTARLWDVATGKEVRRFIGQAGDIYGVAFSPDGRSILTGSRDQTTWLWEVNPPPEPRIFAGHTGKVWIVAYSPDGRYVLTGSDDKTARLWDVRTGREVRQFIGHTDVTWSVAFSPDGRYVLTGSQDKTARLWETATGQELRQFVGHTSAVDHAVFSPDGRSVLTSSNDNTARLWDAATGREVRQFVGHTDLVPGCAFSPDGRYIVTASYDKTARLWDAATGKEIRRFVGHTAGLIQVTFSPNGRYVLTGSLDKTARLWDVATGQEIQRFVGHTEQLENAIFSPDGRYVLTASNDKTVRLWDVTTAQQLRQFSGHTNTAVGIAFSPDGKYIVSGSWDTTARLWRTGLSEVIQLACAMLPRDFSADERVRYLIRDELPTCPTL